eukprot:15366681-Ditylum_brightwellii.AAC.2
METKCMASDDAINSINARLSSLEEFVGGDFEDAVGENHPSVAVTIQEILESFKAQAAIVDQAIQSVADQ